MFKNTENASMLKEAQPERLVRNLNQIIGEMTKALLNDYEVQEQKEILLSVKNNLSKHYEELRQNHMRGAEEYGKKIEILQN